MARGHPCDARQDRMNAAVPGGSVCQASISGNIMSSGRSLSLPELERRFQRLGEVNSVFVLPVEASLDDVGSVHCGREQAGLDRPAAAVDHLMLEGEG